MRLGIFTVAAALAAFVGTTSAQADRSDDMAWATRVLAEGTSVGAKGSRRAARVERTQRVRVASVGVTSDAASEARPVSRRTARAAQTERRQRVRVASIGTGSYSSYSGVGPRPGKWCGWWMRTQRGGGPELNLAWNWSRWGSPSGPQVGAVVVWRHHVGEIVGQAANGRWIVRSGNDGGRVRERARSVAGAVFRI